MEVIQRLILLTLFNFVSFCESDVYYESKYFETSLDHFSVADNKTFSLRYLINRTYWKPAEKAPIFFYTGNEGDVTMFAENTGFMWEIAPEFNALVVFAEHRYYGKSLPFGNLSFTDPKYSGYLTSSQALADYVALVDHIKESYKVANLRIPVVAFGGSYGGMLAAWIRMKYPASFAGSIASSAPIWQFSGMTPCNAFNRVTSSVFSTIDKNCAVNIKKSWSALTNITKTEEGKHWVSTTFKLCKPLNDVKELKNWLNEVYVNLAMTNYPYPTDFLLPLPANPVKAVCKSLFYPIHNSEDLLKSLFQGISVYFNGTGKAKCLNLNQTASDKLGTLGWDFQSCTEMVMPICDDGKSDIFEKAEWDLNKISDDCYNKFKVRPQEHLIEEEYGGKKISWASNIIFSNGLLDPWSSGGVLVNVSHTAIAVIIPEAAHHLDLRSSNEADPISVRAARKFYRKIIRRWIADHKE